MTPLNEDQQGFLDFIKGVTNHELLRTYSSYRFLAEFKLEIDVWKRDACRAEILRRELPIPASQADQERRKVLGSLLNSRAPVQ